MVYDEVANQAHAALDDAVAGAEDATRAEAAVRAFVTLMVDRPAMGRVLLIARVGTEPGWAGAGVGTGIRGADRRATAGDRRSRGRVVMLSVALVGALAGLFTGYLDGTLGGAAGAVGGALRGVACPRGRVGAEQVVHYSGLSTGTGLALIVSAVDVGVEDGGPS